MIDAYPSSSKPHRRLNPLTNEWVLVSPHRNQRPWQGQVENNDPDTKSEHDANCYLCPGNTRANGSINPNYSDTFVFDNDFAALIKQNDLNHNESNTHDLFRSTIESGTCRVICFSPQHNLTLARMQENKIAKVVDLWAAQTSELAQDKCINHVQIFENKGAIMGCSNPHPHGQIWAQNSIPNQSQHELESQKTYYQEHKITLLSEYLNQELKRQERVIYANDGFAVIVPYWASWPFETLLVSKRPVSFVHQLSTDERFQYAQAISKITIKYDNLFNCEFPYSAGIHQAPTDGELHPYWHLHMHFYPPLLRSSTVKKFMVGYEMFAESQRDITPESSAQTLISKSDIHYLDQ